MVLTGFVKSVSVTLLSLVVFCEYDGSFCISSLFLKICFESSYMILSKCNYDTPRCMQVQLKQVALIMRKNAIWTQIGCFILD